MMRHPVRVRLLSLLILTGWTLAQSVEIDYQTNVQSIQDKEAILKCNVVSDFTIKQVTWFKVNKGDKEAVYYYEPALSIDSAYPGYERFSRSYVDNTSLRIHPTHLMDEGIYRCRVLVWDLRQDNSTEKFGPSIPVEKDASMTLVVNVPPERVQLSTFTTGANMTLTCKSEGAKPGAKITWIKTTSDGNEVALRSAAKKTVIEHSGALTDTTVLLYYGLTKHERGTRISCVINHPETRTVFFENVTMVSPMVQNPVQIYLDRLGSHITYSTIDNQHGYLDNPDGLVRISADPGFKVAFNSSVTLTASAAGAFPQPHFMWWTGEQAAHLGDDLYLPYLKEDATYFVLAENPVGRVLLSVPVTVLDAGEINEVAGNQTQDIDQNEVSVNSAGMNGGVIAAIIIACVLLCLLIAVIVWYFTCRIPPDEGITSMKQSKSKARPEESNPFTERKSTLMRTASTQTLEGKQTKNESARRTAASEDNLTSGGRQNSQRRTSTPPPEYDKTEERPMVRHLKEYDESASFVGGYGSRDGLDSASSIEEDMHSADDGGRDTRSELSIPVSTGSGRGRRMQEVV